MAIIGTLSQLETSPIDSRVLITTDEERRRLRCRHAVESKSHAYLSNLLTLHQIIQLGNCTIWKQKGRFVQTSLLELDQEQITELYQLNDVINRFRLLVCG
jgi:hypothetical protein